MPLLLWAFRKTMCCFWDMATNGIRRGLTFITQNPERWWTVRELAEYCQLSDDQFRRNFSRFTGVAPKQYIEDLKLRQAAQLLLTSRMPVAKVAARFGYQDQFHFSRRFKLRIGVSPGQYRKAYLLEHPDSAAE